MLITAKQASEELLSQDDILIISHMSPDGDTLGCAFALYNALTSLGKRVKIRCSDELPNRFSYLYDGYVDSDFDEKYVVCVDVAAVQLFGDKLKDYTTTVDLCIDHHPSNELFAKKTYLDQHAAAACEIMYEVITLLNTPITKRIADCLYTGIATDTGCFKYSNTSANTHIVGAHLFECGTDYEEINSFLFDTKSKSRVQVEQHILKTMEFFYQDKVALIAITQKTVEETNADESELDGLSALPRTIEGVLIGITIREKTADAHKVSIRTTKEVDASEICKNFGGGGHKRAAGCLINEDYDTTKKLLIEVVKKYL
ncbi:MAG: bifunctional oligoribonuclease/PAP phosphatase NrnA [Oscillospiraceae bacterium]